MSIFTSKLNLDPHSITAAELHVHEPEGITVNVC